MIQIIERENLELFEIEKDFRENFQKREDCHNLTSFEAFYLKVTGDCLRPKDSRHFWSNDSYCWFVTEKDAKGNPVNDHLYGVWLDEYGNCMYEDFDAKKLYKVMF